MAASKVDIAFSELMPLIPVPWSIRELVNGFAEVRGRPIIMRARSLPPLVHALLVVRPDQDVIFFDVLDNLERSELQILHEIGHLAMHHSLLTETTLDTESGQGVGGCPYPLEQQAEADLLAATLITAVRSQPQYETATELGRLTSTLL